MFSSILPSNSRRCIFQIDYDIAVETTLMCWAGPVSKILARLVLGALLLSVTSGVFAAACTSIATGNWSAQTTWGAAGTGCVGAPGGIPGAGDTVTIAATNTVTLIANAAASTLTINAATAANGVTLNGFTLAVTGAVAMNAVLTNGITSTLNVGSGTLTAASIAIPGSGTASRVTLVTVSTGTITTTGSITFSGTATTARFISTGASTVNVGGSFGSGGTLTTGGTGTINFNGGAAQTIGTYTTYNNIQINNTAGGVTLTGTTTFGGTLSVLTGALNVGAFTLVVTGATNVTSTLNITSTTGTKTFTGDVTINGAGTWNNSVAEAISFGGNLTNNGTFTSGAGVQTFTAATAQWTGGAAITFSGNVTVNNSLTVNKTAGAVTCSGTLNVGTNLTVQAGTLNLANTTTVTGTTSISGTLDQTTAAGTRTFTGAVTIGGTWSNTANQAIILQGGLSNNGTFTSGTGIYTFNTNSQNIGGTNAITLANATVTGVTLTNTGTLTVSTALAGTGGLTNGANATLSIGGTSAITTLTASAAGNTVNYSGAAQTVKLPAGGTATYYNLTLSGSGIETMPATAMTISNDFIMSGTATTTAAQALTVGDSFTIGSSNTFNAATFTHNVGGDFTNNGTFTAATSTFNFNGAAAQNITGTNGGTTTFNNLTLNNANGLTLSGTHNVTVNTTLTLTTGRLTTGANILYIASGNAVTSAGATDFVVGNLRKRFATGANVARVFEVGTETSGVSYTPVSINFGSVGTAGDFTVSSTAGDHPNIATSTIDGNLSINRYWTLTNNSVTFTAAAGNSVSFTYINSGDYDAGADFNSFYVGRYNSPTWTEITPSSRTATLTTISGAGITSANISGAYQIAEHPLMCYTDDFNRADGPPGSTWVVSSSSGAFGNPVIVSNRLRLTNASGNVATMATLQRTFPGAGNMIRVEFDHYAYGGTGADGIGVVFSDNSVTPAPGAYGGSLGYAQKTLAGGGGADIPGFTGGWLGVGIDEFGNFSNPSEGRIAGPGARAESVSVRGSGTGLLNYRYHAGTAANLVPTVDNNGAAVPPHHYRIKLDHSNGVNAWVTVERDTGAGYVTIVPAYDAKVQTNQAAVPANWILSWTGSTGGSNNIHEIDGLRICATSQAAIPLVNHYAISHSGTGVNCQAEPVTITAHDAAHGAVTLSNATTITLSTSTGLGDWSLTTGAGTLNNGAANDGIATYQFGSESAVVLALKHTTPAPSPGVNINVTDGTTTETSGTAIATEDNKLIFAPSGFRFTDGTNPVTIGTQISGKQSNLAPGAQNLYLQAIRTDTSTGACVGAFPSGSSVNVEMASQCNNPISCVAGKQVSITNNATTTAITSNPNAGPLSYTSVPLLFGANSQAPFSFNYPDAGSISLYARYNIPLASGGASSDNMLGGSTAFVVRPFGFFISGPPSGRTGSTDTVFTTAGTSFNTTLTAVVWAAADDANNDGVPDSQSALSGNAATPNFGQETTAATAILSHALAEPALSPNTGALTGSTNFSGFTSGTKTQSVAFSEVGIIRLLATTSNYLGSGQDVTAGLSTAGLTGVGRFIPHHFDVTKIHGCAGGATFTYAGQPFTVTVTAKNAVGGPTDITKNYDGALGFSKAVTISNAGSITNFSNNAIPAAGASSFGSGQRIQNTVTYTYPVAAKETAPALLTLRAVEDAGGDNVSSVGYTEETAEIRSGRLRIMNAYGSELVDLSIPMRVEYYSTDGWIANGDDTCSSVTLSALANYQGNLSFGETCVQENSIPPCGTSGQGCAASGPMAQCYRQYQSAGYYNLNLRAPGATNEGSVDVTANLNAMTWLRFDWDGNGTNDDPLGKATFGLYKGNPRHIYLRERY